MCGGAAQTVASTPNVPGFIKDAYKGATEAGKQYAKKWGVSQPLETDAYGRLQQNSNMAEQYMPYQQQLIQSLYGGGGLGQGQDYIRNAYGQAQQTYQPYLDQNYLDPMSNPYLQPSIEAARTGAFNDVSNRFAKGGRSFSGAEAGAFGTAATNAALPMLMGQYNQNVGAQQGAMQGLLGGAISSSQGLDASQQGRLAAQMAAPGQISNLNIPEQMQLSIVDRQRKIAADAVAAQSAAIGGLSSYPFGSQQTTTQSSNPFQSLLGGGLGLLGAFM